MMPESRVHIVQIVRNALDTGGGAVAYHSSLGMISEDAKVTFLTDTPVEYQSCGINVDCGSLGSFLYRQKSSVRAVQVLIQFLQLFCFCFYAFSRRRGLRRQPNAVFINHNNEALFGDILVFHNVFLAGWKLDMKRAGIKFFRIFNPVLCFRILRERWIINRRTYSRIVAVSEETKEELVRCYSPDMNVTVIPNGVDTDQFKPCADARRSGREKMDLSEDDFVALFVGYEFEHKGLFVILEALREMKSPVVLVAVGGQDSEIARAKEIAKKLPPHVRVLFTGRQSEVVPYFQMADVFVMASNYEAWGLVGAEAAASGLPLLMTNVGGASDYLREGGNGYFVSSAEEIHSQLERLASDRMLAKKMGLLSRQIAKEFSWEHVSEQYLDLAKEVLRERS